MTSKEVVFGHKRLSGVMSSFFKAPRSHNVRSVQLSIKSTQFIVGILQSSFPLLWYHYHSQTVLLLVSRTSFVVEFKVMILNDGKKSRSGTVRSSSFFRSKYETPKL